MHIGIIYSGIILFTISTASIAGISGGVVLRPIFDAIGYHDALSIAFYMGIAVLTMTVASTVKVVSMGARVKISKVLSLAAGSFLGGVIGQFIMDWIILGVGEGALQILQNALSILSLVFVLAATREGVRKFHLSGIRWYLLAGLGLGTFSTILAIGGGPINVAAFVVLFGLTFKESVVYSIATIFFAQAARVGSIGIEHGFDGFSLNTMLFIIPSAILAGVIGGRLNRKLSEASVLKVFKFVVVSTIALNVFNVATMINPAWGPTTAVLAGLAAAAYLTHDIVLKPRGLSVLGRRDTPAVTVPAVETVENAA